MIDKDDIGNSDDFDAREIDQDAEVETDLCIVGAGAAGITIARTRRVAVST